MQSDQLTTNQHPKTGSFRAVKKHCPRFSGEDSPLFGHTAVMLNTAQSSSKFRGFKFIQNPTTFIATTIPVSGYLRLRLKGSACDYPCSPTICPQSSSQKDPFKAYLTYHFSVQNSSATSHLIEETSPRTCQWHAATPFPHPPTTSHHITLPAPSTTTPAQWVSAAGLLAVPESTPACFYRCSFCLLIPSPIHLCHLLPLLLLVFA